MTTERVMVLDDDRLIREVITERLGRKGLEVEACATIAAAKELLARWVPDIALLDIKLPDGDGTEILELAREEQVPCIMMTAHATVESAVGALKMGADDYLEKPFSLDRLEVVLGNALERSRLRRQVKHLRRHSPLSGRFIGSSDSMTAVLRLVDRIAPADGATVLVLGETGSGKGMIVRLIHDLSPRAKGPFIHVTCSALAETVMESELFGHEKGAFTDARTQKRGLVEVAHGGTLFLDEIGELSVGVQGKLLRFLEDKAFRRVGGTADLKVDVRVIAATNRNLEEEVKCGAFREDLYYRLCVLPIELPPLRHRRSDIPALAAFFVDRFNSELGKRVRMIDDDVTEILLAHDWPGNVRELGNAIERAVLLTDGDRLERSSLPPEMAGGVRPASAQLIGINPDGLDLELLEQELLEEALRLSEGNQTEAGRLLGLSRHQVRNRLLKYGAKP